MDLRDRIRNIRRAKGYTQKELAERAGISPVSLSRIEAGPAPNLKLRTIEALAGALDVSIVQLFIDEETLSVVKMAAKRLGTMVEENQRAG